MRRREFIIFLCNAAATSWPLSVRAQQPAMPVVGFLRNTRSEDSVDLVEAFRQGLTETGYVEGRNVAIKYRWTEGQNDRLLAMAADLIEHQVAVIVAGGNDVIVAAKSATATIPIVFSIGVDPVGLGLVASLNRPGGNITGVTFFSTTLVAKRMELLHELLPKVTTIAYLTAPQNPNSELELRNAREAARAVGLQVHILNANNARDFEPAFASLIEKRAGALIVGGSALFFSSRDQLIALAVRHAVPTIYDQREYVEVGGLISYGSRIADAYRLTGVYVGRILKGEKPADLPVQQSVKVELVINLKTAKALGITVPLPLSGRADELIE
jgi:putative tryptophan/tyrosine transport system substrate-binding protein